MFCSLNTTSADIGLHLSFCLPVWELSDFSFALHTKLSPIKYLTHIFFINLDESCFYFKMFFYIFLYSLHSLQWKYFFIQFVIIKLLSKISQHSAVVTLNILQWTISGRRGTAFRVNLLKYIFLIKILKINFKQCIRVLCHCVVCLYVHTRGETVTPNPRNCNSRWLWATRSGC